MPSKNILVLSFQDTKNGGHVDGYANMLLKKGYNVFHLPFLRTQLSTHSFFVDNLNKWSLAYLKYRTKSIIYNKLYKKIFIKDSRCLTYSLLNYPVSACEILEKCPFTPDVILIGWYDYFLTPKLIYQLHKATGASIVIMMIDELLLGGGCHYPKIGCTQYLNHCHNCPYLKRGKNIAEKRCLEKEHYLCHVPLTVVGTTYDLNLLKSIPAFQHVTTYKTVGTPNIPFVLSKTEARNIFNIPKDDYCILAGCTYIEDERKGVKELIKSLEVFFSRITNRNVTIVVIGNGTLNFCKVNDKVNIINLGYVDFNKMIKAFYACDIFVNSSLADSGPYMVNYAASCGRPVVTYPIGIALDLSISGETAYVAKFMDINDFANGIEFFYKLSHEELEKFSSNNLSLISNISKQKSWIDIIFE